MKVTNLPRGLVLHGEHMSLKWHKKCVYHIGNITLQLEVVMHSQNQEPEEYEQGATWLYDESVAQK